MVGRPGPVTDVPRLFNTASRWFLAGVLLVTSACVSGAQVTGSIVPIPSPSTSPSPSTLPGPGTDDEATLRFALIDRFGQLWYCDRDAFPVGRPEEDGLRANRQAMLADPAYPAILARLHLPSNGTLTDDQALQAYRLWKVLQAIALEPIGNDRYRFDYLAMPAGGAGQGTRSAGIIASDGTITIEQQAPAGAPNCPICLAAATRIDTPAGPIRVDALRQGMPVWTTDRDGRRVPGTVLVVASVDAPPTHRLVHLVLADGRVVDASPGHPLPDGRQLGDLRVGDAVDGSTVMSADRIASGPQTWDVLPSGTTGTYWADGILLRSTLFRAGLTS